MRTLSKLIHTIDSFYTEALKAFRFSKYAQAGWTMPDDPEEDEEDVTSGTPNNQTPLQNITDVIPYIKDKNVAYDVGLAAELYKKALELGDGFAVVAHTINGVLNDYEDELEPEVETALYAVINEIKAKFGGRIPKEVSPKTLETLKQVHNAYEYGVADGAPVPATEEEDQAPEPEEEQPEGVGPVVLDMSGGVSKENAGKGSGRGMSFQDKHRYTDWAGIYNGRANRLENTLNKETNPIYRKRLEALIPKYREVAKLITEHNRLYAKTQPAPGAFPEDEAKLKSVDESIKKITKRERKAQRFNTPLNELSLHELQVLVDDIKYNEKIKDATDKINQVNDPRKKKFLEQIIDYNKLMMSTDINKDKEREARLALIRALEGKGLNRSFKFPKHVAKTYEARMQYLKETGKLDKPRASRKAWWDQSNEDIDVDWDPRERSSISDAEVAKMENAIAEAAALKKPISERHKERWQEEKSHRDTGSLRGLVRDFEKSIAFRKNDLKKPIKKALMKQVLSEKDTLFKNYIDAINAANAEGNSAKVEQLNKDLDKAIDQRVSQLADQDTKIVSYVNGAKRIYEFRDKCNIIEALPEFGKDVMVTEISDISKEIVQDSIDFGMETVQSYANSPMYRVSVGWIDKIVQYFTKLVGTNEQE